MKPYLITIGVLFFHLSGFGQPDDLTFEELETKMEDSPRRTIVFFHTDWCKYCEQMRQTTFLNEHVVSQLDSQFYFVSFNAEYSEDVVFLDHVFRGSGQSEGNHPHELAMALAGQGKEINYPTLVFLDEHYEIIYSYDGFMSSAQLLKNLEVLRE